MKSRFSLFVSTAILFLFLLPACVGVSLKDPLNGTAWTLTSVDKMPPLNGTALTIEFKDGQVGGSSGCNSYGGSYKVKGEKLTTDSIAMTLMACTDSGLMEQEQAFLGYLQDARTFKVTEGRLQIFRSDGKGLTFTPKA